MESQETRQADAQAEQRFGARGHDQSTHSAHVSHADQRAIVEAARAIVDASQPAPEPEPATPVAGWKQGIAEFVGTGALCFIGILVLTAGGAELFANGTKNLVAVALAHGLTIAVMVSATMHISGGQLNPAVTFALWINRKISTAQAALNCVAQVGGAACAALLAKVAIGGSIAAGIPALSSGVSTTQGIVTEAVLTFFLVFVIFGTAVDPRFNAKLGGLAIGLTVTLDILAGGPITGGAMNTARWLGPAIAEGTFPNPVVYLAGPLLGAATASLLWCKVLLDRRNDG
jgi:aquaporin TIP